MQTTDWYELKKTNCTAVYEELVFHDNIDDATWFHNNMRLMAKYAARAICDVFGMAFIDPYYVEPTPEPQPQPAPEPATPQPTIPETPVNDREEVIIPKIPPTTALKGDINKDGQVTAADALLALQATVHKITLTPEQIAAADMNNDGELSAAEALYILRASVGK